MFDVQIWQMIHHWKALVSTLRICKKFADLQKLNFLSQNPVILYKCLQKKTCPKNEKLYIFEKPLTMPFKICKKIFFAKLKQFVSLCQRLLKKQNFIKIWQVEVGQNKDLVCYRKKQSFRQCAWGLRQLVLKPGFMPKGRALGM